MKKFIAMMAALSMVAVMMTGCGGSSSSSAAADGGENSTAAGDTIKIGCLAPLTGEVSSYGIAVANAVQMAVDEINAAGGIGGTPIELITLD